MTPDPSSLDLVLRARHKTTLDWPASLTCLSCRTGHTLAASYAWLPDDVLIVFLGTTSSLKFVVLTSFMVAMAIAVTLALMVAVCLAWKWYHWRMRKEQKVCYVLCLLLSCYLSASYQVNCVRNHYPVRTIIISSDVYSHCRSSYIFGTSIVKNIWTR